jgi:hypothetical protein
MNEDNKFDKDIDLHESDYVKEGTNFPFFGENGQMFGMMAVAAVFVIFSMRWFINELGVFWGIVAFSVSFLILQKPIAWIIFHLLDQAGGLLQRLRHPKQR